MRDVLGDGLKGCDDFSFDARIIDRSRRSRARLVIEPIQPVLGETTTPLADGDLTKALKRRRDLILL